MRIKNVEADSKLRRKGAVVKQHRKKTHFVQQRYRSRVSCYHPNVYMRIKNVEADSKLRRKGAV
nr:hypothetical protein [Tanacetum cinerariifolium]